MELTNLILSVLLIAFVGSVTSVDPPALTDGCLGCICQASSKCNKDIGCTGNFCGALLISWSYWADAGKYVVAGTNPEAQNAYSQCANDLYCAGETVRGYMKKYGKDCNGDGVINCEDFTRIHKLGPYSCDSPSILDTDYYKQYKECAAIVKPQ